MAIGDGLGVSFAPTRDRGRQSVRDGDNGGSPIQRAIEVLNLRLPKVVGGRPIAPVPLLSGPTGGGNIGAVLASLLQQAGALSPPAGPAAPSVPPAAPPPAQGPSPQSQQAGAIPSMPGPAGADAFQPQSQPASPFQTQQPDQPVSVPTQRQPPPPRVVFDQPPGVPGATQQAQPVQGQPISPVPLQPLQGLMEALQRAQGQPFGDFGAAQSAARRFGRFI